MSNVVLVAGDSVLRLVRTSCMQWSVSPPQPPPAANGGQLQPHSLPTGHPLTTTCPPVRFTVDFCPQLDNLLPPSPSPCGHPANQYPLVIPIKSRRKYHHPLVSLPWLDLNNFSSEKTQRQTSHFPSKPDCLEVDVK